MPGDIAACQLNVCAYVCDWGSRCIWKVSSLVSDQRRSSAVSGQLPSPPVDWTSELFVRVHGEPRGLSVTGDGHLVVACAKPGSIGIFDGSSGTKSTIVQIPGIDYPNQAVVVLSRVQVAPASDDERQITIVLCHGEEALKTYKILNEVCVVSATAIGRHSTVVGTVLSRYGFADSCGRGSVGPLSVPAALVVDERLDMLICDCNNNRVIQLDGSLSGCSRKSRIVLSFTSSDVDRKRFSPEPVRLIRDPERRLVAIASKQNIYVYRM